MGTNDVTRAHSPFLGCPSCAVPLMKRAREEPPAATGGAAPPVHNKFVPPKKDKKTQVVGYVMNAADQRWSDPTLADWDPNDFRIFVGDLGPECTDQLLIGAFNKYQSFQRARVINDKLTGKNRGFGFVSFKDPHDGVKALLEMNGKYIGNRPVKLRKSTWQERAVKAIELRPEKKKTERLF